MQRDYHSCGIVCITLIVGTIVGWAAILAPSHAASFIRAGVEGNDRIVVSTVSNAARKGDRLTITLGRSGDHAGSEPKPAAKSVAKIPVGCEPAFSRLARFKNVAVRCVTNAENSVKAA